MSTNYDYIKLKIFKPIFDEETQLISKNSPYVVLCLSKSETLKQLIEFILIKFGHSNKILCRFFDSPNNEAKTKLNIEKNFHNYNAEDIFKRVGKKWAIELINKEKTRFIISFLKKEFIEETDTILVFETKHLDLFIDETDSVDINFSEIEFCDDTPQQNELNIKQAEVESNAAKEKEIDEPEQKSIKSRIEELTQKSFNNRKNLIEFVDLFKEHLSKETFNAIYNEDMGLFGIVKHDIEVNLNSLSYGKKGIVIICKNKDNREVQISPEEIEVQSDKVQLFWDYYFDWKAK